MKSQIVAVLSLLFAAPILACGMDFALSFHLSRTDVIVVGEVVEVQSPKEGDGPSIGIAKIAVSELIYDPTESFKGTKIVVIPMPYSGLSTDDGYRHKKGDRAFWLLKQQGNVLMLLHPGQKLAVTEENRKDLLKEIDRLPERRLQERERAQVVGTLD